MANELQKMIEEHGQEVQNSVNEHLQGDENGSYISKEEIQNMLDNHFKRVEKLMGYYSEQQQKGMSISDVYNQLQEKLKNLIKEFTDSLRQRVSEAKKNLTDNIENVKSNARDSINEVKENANSRINNAVIGINDRIKSFSQRLDNYTERDNLTEETKIESTPLSVRQHFEKAVENKYGEHLFSLDAHVDDKIGLYEDLILEHIRAGAFIYEDEGIDLDKIEKQMEEILASGELSNELDIENKPSIENDNSQDIHQMNAYEEALNIQENYGLVSNTVQWNNEKFLSHLKEINPQEYERFNMLKEINNNQTKQMQQQPNKSELDTLKDELSTLKSQNKDLKNKFQTVEKFFSQDKEAMKSFNQYLNNDKELNLPEKQQEKELAASKKVKKGIEL